MDVRLDVTSVAVGPNPYKASAIVGDPATVWSDGSDATYTETWLSARSTETYGTNASGPLELLTLPYTSVQSISFGIRFSTRNEGNATYGRVAAWLEKLDGTYICSLDGGSGGPDLNYRETTVPSPTTLVHTLDSYDYSGTSQNTVAARLTQGVVMRIGRYSPNTNPPPPADYEITVYEAWIQVQVPDPLPPAWAFVALDDDGNYLEGRADTLQVSSYGQGFYGEANGPAQLSFDGAFLWRNLTYADGFDRYNLQTGMWEATGVTRSADGSHVVNSFAGYDTVNNLAVFVRNRAQAGESPGFVEVRAHDSGSWVNPVPNGIPGTGYTAGPAIATYDPAVPGLPSSFFSTANQVEAGYMTRVQDGYIYYTAPIDNPSNRGHNPDGTPYGVSSALCRMDLSNGAVEVVYQFPYRFWHWQTGVETTYSDDWYDNSYYGFGALVIIGDPPPPVIEYVDDGVRRIFS